MKTLLFYIVLGLIGYIALRYMTKMMRSMPEEERARFQERFNRSPVGTIIVIGFVILSLGFFVANNWEVLKGWFRAD